MEFSHFSFVPPLTPQRFQREKDVHKLFTCFRRGAAAVVPSVAKNSSRIPHDFFLSEDPPAQKSLAGKQ